MIVLICGVARTGKSTVTRKLKERYTDALVFHGDTVKNAIINNKYQSFRLSNKDERSLYVQSAITDILNAFVRHNGKDRLYIFDGSELTADWVNSNFNECYGVVLGHGGRSAEDIERMCLEHDRECDWSYDYHGTKQFKEDCKRWEMQDKSSLNSQNSEKRPYVDTYEDREDKLNNVFEKLCERIDSLT